MLLQTSYRLTTADFNEAQAKHKGLTGRFLQLVGVLIVLGALPSLFAHQYLQGSIGVVVGSFLAFGTGLLASYSFKKETSLQLETKAVITEQGLLLSSTNGESRLNWNAFIRYAETKNIFVLYVQSRMFHILPKKAFSQDDIAIVRNTFIRNIADSSRSMGTANTKSLLLAVVLVTAIVLVYFAVHATRQ